MQTRTIPALSIIAMLACADPPPSKYPVQQVHVEDTTLGPGDVFDVRVYRQDELSSTYVVSSEGSISFPLIGDVVVANKSPQDVERDIRDRLADGYLVDPQVSVMVKEYKSKKVSVFGQVRQPGTLSFAEGMTVVEAISRAGGFTEMARKNAVTVTRAQRAERRATKQTYTIPVESIGQGRAPDFLVRPGDVVFVPRRIW
jgi:polysaccharide export outer membrane protein